MNWIQGIQRAIDYVEANITEELDFDDVARQAFSSPFHFQRVFSMLCGFPSAITSGCAGFHWPERSCRAGTRKIIEIALKYGYDTPESFSPRVYPVPRHCAERGQARRQGPHFHAAFCQTDINRRQQNGLQN